MSDVGRVLRNERLQKSERERARARWSIGGLYEFVWDLANAFQLIGEVRGIALKRHFGDGGNSVLRNLPF